MMKVHGIHFKREKRLYSRKHVLYHLPAQPVLHITPLAHRPYSSECLLSICRTETSRASTLHPRELPVKSQPWKSLPEGCSFWGLTDLFLFGGAINPRLEMLWGSPHTASNLLLRDWRTPFTYTHSNLIFFFYEIFFFKKSTS